MDRKGSAVWKGGLKDGKGVLSTETGVLKDQPYTFFSRFEGGGATNPEELIGAAHAACFAMYLSGQLAEAGMTADELRATSTVTIENATITKAHLDVTARVSGGDEAKFRKAVEDSKTACPVSKLLNAEITLDAKLER